MENDKRRGETRMFFTGKSKTYYCRPKFHKNTYKILKKYGLNKTSVISELGAGTGRFTKEIAKHAGKIYAVEPNEEMFQKGKEICKKIKNIEYVYETAESTKLLEKSQDFVFAVQSFHYFNKPKLLTELNRILKDDGQFAIIWNMSGTGNTDFDKVWSEVMEKYKIKTTGSGDNHNLSNEREIVFKNGKYDEVKLVGYDYMSFKRVLGYVNSISFCPKPSEEEYKNLLNQLSQGFNKCKKFGRVKLSTETTIQIGKINRG